MEKTFLFHVTGMHCQACILMTESELLDLPNVTRAKSSLETNTVELAGDFGDKDASTVARDLTTVLTKHGYALFVEKPAQRKSNWHEFKLALPLAAAVVLGLALLQEVGLVDLVTSSKVTYGTAFAIGVIASLSTCLAVVGGLVLSMSATFAKHGDRAKPQLLFHAGRLVSFFVLGGVIGMAGSAFQLNGQATFVLGVAVGIVMLVLGINLLDVFGWSKKLQPSMPKSLSGHAYGVSKLTHAVTPLLVGVATFFLPCGFTQSMQIYTLTTGGFLRGGLTMLAFALGTFPVLALISFSSYGVNKNPNRGVFFKTAGIVVIAFALFNIAGSLVAAGYIKPFFNL